MILVDSHCHLDCLDFSQGDDIKGAIERAQEANVHYFLCVCITEHQFDSMLNQVSSFDNVFISVGTHPNEKAIEESSIDELLALAHNDKVIAIGETGLDYFRTQGDSSWQLDRFRKHIKVSAQTQKPLIVHSRNAREDTIKILTEEKANEVGGVLHCFTENWEMAKKALDLNFYISFSGIITFANASELRDVAARVPLDRILIETDSPYLAPVPFRGKSNEPAYVRLVAEKIAEIKKLPLETIADHTTRNFFNLFKQARRL